MSRKLKAAEEKLRLYALSLPEAVEEHPWDHIAVKVRKKTFVFLGGEAAGGELSVTVKLPISGEMALTLPYVERTGYGLGASGWVTARPAAKDIDLDLLKGWIAQSYRAAAPKKLAAVLDRVEDRGSRQ
jgi:predicted DNA-binding protein (MmcQ/YjbR family)